MVETPQSKSRGKTALINCFTGNRPTLEARKDLETSKDVSLHDTFRTKVFAPAEPFIFQWFCSPGNLYRFDLRNVKSRPKILDTQCIDLSFDETIRKPNRKLSKPLFILFHLANMMLAGDA